jgi:hypothetical protein
VFDRCRTEEPVLREMPDGGPGQRAACHLDALPELQVVPEAA